jgi:hypothetical protein
MQMLQDNYKRNKLINKRDKQRAQLAGQTGVSGLQAGLEASRAQSANAAATQTANLERLKLKRLVKLKNKLYNKKLMIFNINKLWKQEIGKRNNSSSTMQCFVEMLAWLKHRFNMHLKLLAYNKLLVVDWVYLVFLKL